ncbi:MAG: ABC transporter permease [Christensenellales bacterium]
MKDVNKAKTFNQDFKKTLKKSWTMYRSVYLILIPVVLWYIAFCYYPMYGIVLAFKDYLPKNGILGSEWVGFEHFIWLFETNGFLRALKNTIVISLLKLVFCFPIPIILSLFLNEIGSKKLKKGIQTAIYLPYFISWVVIAGMIYSIFAVNGGIINNIILAFGGEAKSFMTDSNYFYPILIISEIWKNAGWGTVIYIAAMSGVNAQLYEAAEIDGCGRFGKMRYVTLPCIAPTIMLMFIMQIGNILNAGFDSIFNLYNKAVLDVADILDTYAYTIGISKGYVGRGSALGLFKTVINFLLLLGANMIVKKKTGYGLYE